jgi:hypothetical protein
MTGLLWYLHVNPKVSSDLTTEIRNEFQSLDDITLQRCMRLPYLQACIEEGLRMHSPVKMGLPRVTPPEGMVIVGKFVPGQVRLSPLSPFCLINNILHPLSSKHLMSIDYCLCITAGSKSLARQFPGSRNIPSRALD